MISKAPRVLLSLLLIALICVLAIGQSGDPRAEKVERVFRELELNYYRDDTTPHTYLLTEQELNSFLAAQLERQERPGVKSLSVRLKPGSFITFAEVDLQELRYGEHSGNSGLLGSLLAGQQALEAEGSFSVQNGRGVYHVQWARLNGIPIPASLANSLLSRLGQNHDPPFDPTEPFSMPYNLETVTCQPGQVVIQTGKP